MAGTRRVPVLPVALSAALVLGAAACQAPGARGAATSPAPDAGTSGDARTYGDAGPAGTPAPDPTPGPQPAPAPAPDGVFLADEAGNLRHLQSGVDCPLNWGEFTRVEQTVYQADGSDVGCNYVDDDQAVFTVYAYRSGLSLAEEVDAIMQQVRQRHPVSRPAEIGLASAFDAFVADAIAFEAPGGRTFKSGVVLTEARGWRLKARITYPAEAALEVEQLALLALRGWADRAGTGQQTPAPAEMKT